MDTKEHFWGGYGFARNGAFKYIGTQKQKWKTTELNNMLLISIYQFSQTTENLFNPKFTL